MTSHDHHDHGQDSHHDHPAHAHGGHGHHHGPPDLDRLNRAFVIGVALNLGFVVAEGAAGLVASSLALLADAGHNLSDVLGLALAWGAAALARRKPTRRRTYGFGRSSILAALANAVFLLVSVGAILVESVRRLDEPQPVAGGLVMAVAGVGVAINLGTALLFMRGRESDINVRGAFLHMAADAAVSLGVVVSGLVVLGTGWQWLDPVVGIVIAAVILWSTWDLLRESVDLALDAVPAGIDRDAVEAWLAGRPGVVAVHDLHIWGMSTTQSALTAHLVRPEPPDDHFLHEVEAELHSRFGIGHATLQVERGTHECRLAPADVV